MRDIRSEVEDEQYEWLTSLKNYFGYTWKGLILEGAKELDTLEMDTSQTVYASNSPQPVRRTISARKSVSDQVLSAKAR